MKIGIDASRANRTIRSGIENYSLQVILALARNDPENEYVLYIREDPIDELRDLPANFSIKVLHDAGTWAKVRKVFHLPQMWTHKALKKELTENPVDILFVPGHVLPSGYKGKSVVVVHDIGYEFVPDVYSWQQRLYLKNTTKAMIKNANKIVSVSEKTKQDLVNLYKADENKIEVIYPGIDRALFSQKKSKEKTSEIDDLELPAQYLLFVGNLAPKKGLETLIKAFGLFAYRKFTKQLKDQETKILKDADQQSFSQETSDDEGHPIEEESREPSTEFEIPDMDEMVCEVDLVLVGKGSQAYIERLKSLAAASLVENKVHFPGYLQDEKLRNMVRNALLYVQPSRYEGFGLPVVEAMASGVPVIVSDAGALLEVADEAGEVVKAGDEEAWAEALGRLVSDTDARKKMISAGLKRVKEFDWDKAAIRLQKVWGEIVKEHSP